MWSAKASLFFTFRLNDIAVYADGSTAVVLCAIDNLAKGMASQAVQNLNILFGLPEATGLLRPGSRT